MTLKRTEVVMLPTKQKVENSLIFIAGKLKYLDKYPAEYGLKSHHLYFLSNEEIKVGDWILAQQTDGSYFRHHVTEDSIVNLSKENKKIIATTDKSLGLPQPSDEFIKVFIEEYNKGNIIEWVNVEYETIHADRAPNGFETLLKVNSKNEIAIRKVKDSWSKTEVVALCRKYGREVIKRGYPSDMRWIEENL